MKLFILCLISIFPLSSIAMDSYDELTQRQKELLKDYKEVTLICEKSPACRKTNQHIKALKEPSLLQMEINLKLMADDLMRIQNELK